MGGNCQEQGTWKRCNWGLPGIKEDGRITISGCPNLNRIMSEWIKYFIPQRNTLSSLISWIEDLCWLFEQYYFPWYVLEGFHMNILITHVCVCSLSCVQLFCDPMDCSSAGSSVHGILQGRMLEWVAPSLGDLPNPGTETRPLLSPALACGFFAARATWEAPSW